MHVCVVYDRLNKIGGAEQVFIHLHDLYPTATWYNFHVWDLSLGPYSQLTGKCIHHGSTKSRGFVLIMNGSHT